MYYYINGEYVEKGENYIVIDAGGVGYKIYTSLATISNMPEYGKKVKVFTHFFIRLKTDSYHLILVSTIDNIHFVCISRIR